jgi:trans-aconitate methyltransferase
VSDYVGFQPTDPAVLKAIFDAVPLHHGDRLVDIGCGDGNVMKYWDQRFPVNPKLGIEIDPLLCAEAAQRCPCDLFLNADATRFRVYADLFYMFNPFRGEAMHRFEALYRNSHLRLIYNATHDLEIFTPNWRIEHLKITCPSMSIRAAVLSPLWIIEP